MVPRGKLDAITRGSPGRHLPVQRDKCSRRRGDYPCPSKAPLQSPSCFSVQQPCPDTFPQSFHLIVLLSKGRLCFRTCPRKCEPKTSWLSDHNQDNNNNKEVATSSSSLPVGLLGGLSTIAVKYLAHTWLKHLLNEEGCIFQDGGHNAFHPIHPSFSHHSIHFVS